MMLSSAATSTSSTNSRYLRLPRARRRNPRRRQRHRHRQLARLPSQRADNSCIEAQHPDTFICGRLDDQPDQVLAALLEMRLDLKNPLVSMAELLASLEGRGPAQSVAEPRQLITRSV